MNFRAGTGAAVMGVLLVFISRLRYFFGMNSDELGERFDRIEEMIVSLSLAQQEQWAEQRALTELLIFHLKRHHKEDRFDLDEILNPRLDEHRLKVHKLYARLRAIAAKDLPKARKKK
jgi:hypothetical protein